MNNDKRDLLDALRFILAVACIDSDDLAIALNALALIRGEAQNAIAKATRKEKTR